MTWTTRETRTLLGLNEEPVGADHDGSEKEGPQKDQTDVGTRQVSDPESSQGEKNGGVQILARRLGRGILVAKDDPEGR